MCSSMKWVHTCPCVNWQNVGSLKIQHVKQTCKRWENFTHKGKVRLFSGLSSTLTAERPWNIFSERWRNRDADTETSPHLWASGFGVSEDGRVCSLACEDELHRATCELRFRPGIWLETVGGDFLLSVALSGSHGWRGKRSRVGGMADTCCYVFWVTHQIKHTERKKTTEG